MRGILFGMASSRAFAAGLGALAAFTISGAAFAQSNPPAMFMTVGDEPAKPAPPSEEPPPTEMPAQMFQGCAGPDTPAATPKSGRDRIEETRRIGRGHQAARICEPHA